MALSQRVETYRFWEIVALWAKETLEHELVVAKALARGVVCEGLCMSTVDPRWADPGDVELRGYPMVGFRSQPGSKLCLLTAGVLEHLLAIVRTGEEPLRDVLHEGFIHKDDFRQWLDAQQLPRPAFWFDNTLNG